MIRRFGWVLLVGAGVVLGGVLNLHQGTDAGAVAASADDDTRAGAESLQQLKEINTQLKEINSLLHTGLVKVVVVLNPDAK